MSGGIAWADLDVITKQHQRHPQDAINKDHFSLRNANLNGLLLSPPPLSCVPQLVCFRRGQLYSQPHSNTKCARDIAKHKKIIITASVNTCSEGHVLFMGHLRHFECA